jgi:hypothetical protein
MCGFIPGHFISPAAAELIMTPRTELMQKHHTRSGFALVIVLAFILLLTFLVVAFFSRAASNRQLAASSARRAKSDLLAQSALEIIIGDLKQEISDGSIHLKVPGDSDPPEKPVLFQPRTASDLLPKRSGNPPPDSNGDPIPNLIRRSVRSDSLPISSRASAVNSSEPSANGRAVIPSRWNKHYLIPRLDNSTVQIDTTPVTEFIAPDWVLVTRSGTKEFLEWTTSLKNNSHPDYVTGRYACAIYDMGGLIDINAAGFPSGLTIEQESAKGPLALADLKQLLPSGTNAAKQRQINNIVGWRHYATAQPSGNFSNHHFAASQASRWFEFITNPRTSFLQVAPQPFNGMTDQMLLNRQDLIDLRRSLGFSQAAL